MAETTLHYQNDDRALCGRRPPLAYASEVEDVTCEDCLTVISSVVAVAVSSEARRVLQEIEDECEASEREFRPTRALDFTRAEPGVREESRAMLAAMVRTYGVAAVVAALADACADRAAAEEDPHLAKTWTSDEAVLRQAAQVVG